MKRYVSLLCLIAALFAATSPASAGDVQEAQPRHITVGTSEFTPMSMAQPDGSREGFDIDVMNDAAKRLGLEVTYREYTFGDLIPAIERGEVQAVISGMTMTEQRETRVDFTHPYLDTGLSILVGEEHAQRVTGIGAIFNFTFLKGFMQALLFLGLFCLFGGFLLWLSNRKAGTINPKFMHGMGDASWLTLVTSSTVGYGDLFPKGWRGRIVGAFIMIVGTTVYGLINGLIVSNMTAQALESDINSIKDLRGKKVATVEGTTSEPHVKRARAKTTLTKNGDDALKLLDSGEVEAVVFDATALQYRAAQDVSGELTLVGGLFDRQSYGIALPTGSPLRERLNQALLAMRMDGTYDRLHTKWFGEDAER